ncbi:hypothetical protein KCP78_22465 [Salmonella enterica subsp. enterica]|nr:hypothetical protein KCP78_22465 [Salmonella enterica subsp. enterica]
MKQSTKPSYILFLSLLAALIGTVVCLHGDRVKRSVSPTVDHFCVYDHRFYAFVMRAMGNCCSNLHHKSSLLRFLRPVCPGGILFSPADVLVLLGKTGMADVVAITAYAQIWFPPSDGRLAGR